MGIPVPFSIFPFSGHKQSFFGDLHAMGKDGVAFYTETKSVTSVWFTEDDSKKSSQHLGRHADTQVEGGKTMRSGALYRFVACVAATLSLAVFAQGYPARTITLVVPFAAGGPTDTIGRLMAERMSKSLGQAIVVENVAGAGGTLANIKVMKAPADGYLFAIGHVGTHVLAPVVQGLNVDYVNDFEPVAQIAANPQIMVSRNGVPAKGLKEFIAWVKANPGKVTYGTGGPGTPSHVMAVHFAERVGSPLIIVHYKGSGPRVAGRDRGACRHHVRPGGHRAGAGASRARARLRGHGEDAACVRAGHSDRG